MNLSVSEIVGTLSKTPYVLQALLEDTPHSMVESNEGEGTFSPLDVVAHLIHGEKTDWIPRLEIILQHGEQVMFTPFDRFNFPTNTPMAELLSSFAALRGANLERVRNLDLTPSQLSLTGKHPEFGMVTLSELLNTWVVHDLGHIAQIVRVMSKQLKGAVGPWQAYLGILKH